MRRLQLGQLLQQGVKFPVGNRRLGKHVILVVVGVQFSPKCVNPLEGVHAMRYLKSGHNMPWLALQVFQDFHVFPTA